MKTIPIIYTGTLAEVEIEIRHGQTLTAKRGGKPVLVAETLAAELLARGDFIAGDQHRNGGAKAPE